MVTDLSGIGLLSGLSTVVSASVVVPPREDGLTIIGGGGDSWTDLEDELPTPDVSLSTDAAQPEVGPAPRALILSWREPFSSLMSYRRW